MRNDNVVIKTERLRKTFGEIVAVDNVSIEIFRGEIFGLVGPNGAGKTTLIRLLNGLLIPDKGNAFVFGYSAVKLPLKIKKKIGYMTQYKALYPDLTARENIDFFARLNGIKDESQRKRLVEEMLQLLEIEKWADVVAYKLSGGTQQRVSLACAMVHNPDLLFLDEPTVGIDPDLRKKFWDYFRQLVESGKTIIITTHYLEEAKYCDRIGMMYRGRIISLGSLSEILSRVSFGWRLRVTTEKKINQEIIDEITSSFNVKLEAIRDREIILRYDNGSVIDDLILFFNKRNLVVEDVETIPPSLSDMFIHFIKKEFFEGEVS